MNRRSTICARKFQYIWCIVCPINEAQLNESVDNTNKLRDSIQPPTRCLQFAILFSVAFTVNLRRFLFSSISFIIHAGLQDRFIAGSACPSVVLVHRTCSFDVTRECAHFPRTSSRVVHLHQVSEGRWFHGGIVTHS